MIIDTLRKALWFGLAALLVWLWNAWEQEHPRAVARQSIATEYAIKPAQKKPLVSGASIAQAIPIENQITFQTDVIKGVIDKQGGHLVYLELLKHAESIEDQKKLQQPFILLDHSANRYHIAQTELVQSGEHLKHSQSPFYQSNATKYTLSTDQESLSINLHRKEDSVEITKQFVLRPGKYTVDINYHINNKGDTTWKGYLYAQLKQYALVKNSWFGASSYKRGVISSEKKPYEKIALDKIGRQRLPQDIQQGWLSFVEPYFASAWISKLPFISYYSYRHDNVYTLGMLGSLWEVSPGEAKEEGLSLYVGPKSMVFLKESAKHLDLLVDYGILWFVATSLFWLLQQCHHWIGNWGWSIVCVTLALKLFFYRSSAKSFHSSLVMARLQPELEILKSRYSHDPYQLMQANSALYQREKINPYPLDWSMLLQFPLTLGLYWVLGDSVELRHQSFLWVKDLSGTDPYYILPLLFGLTMKAEMFIQQRITTAANHNPVQNILPILLGMVAINFPSGVVLYGVTQNIFSILQKWWILSARAASNRQLETTRHSKDREGTIIPTKE